jgi:hypothetical protein
LMSDQTIKQQAQKIKEKHTQMLSGGESWHRKKLVQGWNIVKCARV